VPPPPVFVTVPHELQTVVHICYKHLKDEGFVVKIEYREYHYPETATMFATSGGAQHFYIFDAKIKIERCKLWAGYGHSCSRPTFVVLCLPETARIRAEFIAQANEFGFGITIISDLGVINQVVAPRDLTLNLPLPPIDGHRVQIKRALKAIYNRISKGDWKRGFEESCKLVERKARDYLVREARAGNVRVVAKSGTSRPITVADVERMPMGALADVFCNKLPQSQIDSLLCGGLKQINPDRIDVAHNKLTKRKELRLRQNVPKHLWTINNMLKTLPA